MKPRTDHGHIASGWTRRGFVGRLALGAAAIGPFGGWNSMARAGVGPGPLRGVEEASEGVTLHLELDRAPFPFPGEPYRDRTTLVFVPRHFRPRSGRLDAVVHFHGHRTLAEEAMRRHQLREQVAESRQSVILVMPQGPVRAVDSGGGKLDEPGGFLALLTEVRRTLQRDEVSALLGPSAPGPRDRVGAVALSVHSGGYRVAANCLDVGGYPVREVWLFDGLYGSVDIYADWLAASRRRKLVSVYAEEGASRHNRRLMALLDRRAVPYVRETPERRLTRHQLVRRRAVFIRTELEHEEVPWRENALRDCLFASSFARALPTDWFDARRAPRSIDLREPVPGFTPDPMGRTEP